MNGNCESLLPVPLAKLTDSGTFDDVGRSVEVPIVLNDQDSILYAIPTESVTAISDNVNSYWAMNEIIRHNVLDIDIVTMGVDSVLMRTNVSVWMSLNQIIPNPTAVQFWTIPSYCRYIATDGVHAHEIVLNAVYYNNSAIRCGIPSLAHAIATGRLNGDVDIEVTGSVLYDLTDRGASSLSLPMLTRYHYHPCKIWGGVHKYTSVAQGAYSLIYIAGHCQMMDDAFDDGTFQFPYHGSVLASDVAKCSIYDAAHNNDVHVGEMSSNWVFPLVYFDGETLANEVASIEQVLEITMTVEPPVVANYQYELLYSLESSPVSLYLGASGYLCAVRGDRTPELSNTESQYVLDVSIYGQAYNKSAFLFVSEPRPETIGTTAGYFGVYIPVTGQGFMNLTDVQSGGSPGLACVYVSPLDPNDETLLNKTLVLEMATYDVKYYNSSFIECAFRKFAYVKVVQRFGMPDEASYYIRVAPSATTDWYNRPPLDVVVDMEENAGHVMRWILKAMLYHGQRFDVHISHDGGGSHVKTTSDEYFVFAENPVLTRVVPTRGSVSNTQLAVVYGSNFLSNAQIACWIMSVENLNDTLPDSPKDVVPGQVVFNEVVTGAYVAPDLVRCPIPAGDMLRMVVIRVSNNRQQFDKNAVWYEFTSPLSIEIYQKPATVSYNYIPLSPQPILHLSVAGNYPIHHTSTLNTILGKIIPEPLGVAGAIGLIDKSNFGFVNFTSMRIEGSQVCNCQLFCSSLLGWQFQCVFRSC